MVSAQKSTPASRPARATTTTAPGSAAAAKKSAANSPQWSLSHYIVRQRKFGFGNQYRIEDPAGNLIAFSKQKMFKIREDIRFWTDEGQGTELFRLATQKIIDFNANFEVTESATGAVLGYIRRRGMKSSLYKDHWLIFDAQGRHVGDLHESSGFVALVRRFVDLGFLLPTKFEIFLGPEGSAHKIATFKQRFQIFGDTYDLTRDEAAKLDGRVLVGLLVCVDAIEEQ